jgi:hypothetical protein
MPQATVAGDIHQPLDVQLNFPPQIALDPILAINHLANAPNLFLGQVAHPRARVDIGLLEDDHTIRGTDPIDIGDRDLDLLVAWDVHPGNTSHVILPVENCLFAQPGDLPN